MIIHQNYDCSHGSEYKIYILIRKYNFYVSKFRYLFSCKSVQNVDNGLSLIHKITSQIGSRRGSAVRNRTSRGCDCLKIVVKYSHVTEKKNEKKKM